MADEDLFQPLAGILKSRGKPGDPRVYRAGIHHGIDYPTPEGSTVYSIDKGTVILTDDQWKIGDGHDRGNWVVIDHGNGYASSYQHLSELLVQVGDKVQGGVPIAKSGVTGGARANPITGATAPVMNPHLHFAMMTRNNPGRKLIADPEATNAFATRLVVDPITRTTVPVAPGPQNVDVPPPKNLFTKILDFFGGGNTVPVYTPPKIHSLPKPPPVEEDPFIDMTPKEIEDFKASLKHSREWATQTPPDGGTRFPRYAPRGISRPAPPTIQFPRRPIAPPPPPIRRFVPPPVIKHYTPPPPAYKPPPITIPKPYQPPPYKPQPPPPMTRPGGPAFVYRPPAQPYRPPISRPPAYRITYNNLDGIPKPGTPATNFKGMAITMTRF
jgi:hypothetical protein